MIMTSSGSSPEPGYRKENTKRNSFRESRESDPGKKSQSLPHPQVASKAKMKKIKLPRETILLTTCQNSIKTISPSSCLISFSCRASDSALRTSILGDFTRTLGTRDSIQKLLRLEEKYSLSNPKSSLQNTVNKPRPLSVIKEMWSSMRFTP